MSRQKNSVEKTISDLSPRDQLFAVNFGRKGLEAIQAGVYFIAQWLWALAECKSMLPNASMDELRKQAVTLVRDQSAQLEALLFEAAHQQDGTKLRILADAIEVSGPRQPHDPTESILLAAKHGAKPMLAPDVVEYVRKTCPKKTPTEKTVHNKAKKLDATLAKGKTGPVKGTKQRRSFHRSRR